MTEEIKIELRNLEEKYKIKILYAIESGSRAWGFASKDSDWDVRFIYVHQYDWYLSVDDKKDNIEIMLPGDIDLAGWELRKALLLYKKSNPPLFEWLRSPIIYKEEFSLTAKLREHATQFFNLKSCIYHYIHMAQRNYTAYFKEDVVRLKKYFYVLRPVMACSWIERTGDMAPMEFEQLLTAQPMTDEVRSEINKLLKRKMEGDELDREQRIPAIDAFIDVQLAHFKIMLQEFDFRKQLSNDELNVIFRSTLAEVWGSDGI